MIIFGNTTFENAAECPVRAALIKAYETVTDENDRNTLRDILNKRVHTTRPDPIVGEVVISQYLTDEIATAVYG